MTFTRCLMYTDMLVVEIKTSEYHTMYRMFLIVVYVGSVEYVSSVLSKKQGNYCLYIYKIYTSYILVFMTKFDFFNK